MAVGRMRSAVGDLPGLADGALDGVEVFADFAADGNAEEALFKSGTETRVEFTF